MKDEDVVIRIEGGMPAIISEEDFEAVQEKLRANKSMAGSESQETLPSHRSHLLWGVWGKHAGSHQKQRKEEFQVKLESLKVAHEVGKVPLVSEEEVLQLINKVKGYVVDRNIPECKKFIRDFVKRFDVYQDYVEVTLNVAFSMSRYIILQRKIVVNKESVI